MNTSSEVLERSESRPDIPSRSLSLLFVIFQTGTRANGGVESVTRVIEGLEGVDVTVVTQMETPVVDRWRKVGARVEVWPLPHAPGPLRRLGQIGTLVRFNRRVSELLANTKVDVVHCNDIRAMWHGAPGAWMAGVPVVFNVRDVKAPESSYRWHWRISALAQVVVVLSREMRDEISERLPMELPSADAPRVEWIYSIVDPERFRPPSPEERGNLRRELGIGEDEFAVGYVAAVTSKKAQDRLIERGMPLFLKRIPSGRLHLVGDFAPEHSQYAARCQALARKLDAPEVVHFAGFEERVERWYRAVDILIVASEREGLARCMIEGIACGVPVVSFDVASAREILEGGAGVVVPRGDYAGLIGAVADLAARPQERSAMGAEGVRLAARLFDGDRVVAQYRCLYAELAE